MSDSKIFDSRASKTTNSQFELMLNFMKRHGDLSTKSSGPLQGRVESRKLWSELIKSLNVAGPEKTLKQWFKVWADWKSKVKSKIRLYNANMRFGSLKPLDLELGQFMELMIAGVNADRSYKDPETPIRDRRFRLNIHGITQKPRTRVAEVRRRRRKNADGSSRHRVITQIERMKLAIDKKMEVRKKRVHDLKKKQVTTKEDIEKVLEKRLELEERILDIQAECLDLRQKAVLALDQLFSICTDRLKIIKK